MSGVVATVSVHQSGSGPGIDVCFEFPPTGQAVHLPLPDHRPLEAVRRKAGFYLDRVVPLVARLNATPDQATNAFHVLLNQGRELANLLAQNDIGRMLELEAAFQAAWPDWQAADWTDPMRPIPLVEMRCHDETFPLELLPLFDFGNLPALRTYDDLVRVASRFLGFATVVRRLTSSRLPSDHVLRNVPALPVQFIRHRGLGATQDEERFLSSLHGHVHVDGPWPVRESEAAVRETLTQALFDGSSLNGAAVSGPPVQVQHFACHCDTTAELDDEYLLTLSTESGRAREVSFGQLREAHWKSFFLDREKSRERAVIVLNACGSSRTNPLTAFSFPRWFMSCGHRAFIGSETKVPDGVASGFAAAFYGRLLERRRPLGEAVVWARRDLLRDFRNPLGLLYIMYGDTELTVEQPRPGVYRASA